jgi:hypothetical protein
MKMGILCAAALAAFAGAANADLITNGGFETGDFSGWSQFGDTGFTGVDGSSAHSGSFGSYYGPTDPAGGGIQQTLAANAGDQLQIDFWYRVEGAFTPNFMSASVGSTTLLSLTDYTNDQFVHFSTVVTADSNNPMLSFTFFNSPSYWDLDDVSVNVVPAPGSLALLGLGGLLAGRRRR